jgi:ribosome biogenesis ATPase
MADSKLFFLVKRILLDSDNGIVVTDSTSSSLHVQKVFDILRRNHTEYQRKNHTQLRKGVETTMKKAVLAIQQEQQNTSRSVTETKGQKRIREGGTSTAEDEEEELSADEKEALRLDQVRDTLRAAVGSGSMLNASLRSNYLQRQKQKEHEIPVQEGGDDLVPEAPSAAERTINEAITSNEEKQPPSSAAKSSDTKKKKKIKRSASTSSPAADNGKQGTHWLTVSERPKVRYSDLGGMNNVLQEIRQLIEYPLTHPEIFVHLGVEPPRGVLFRGPPGTGKTLLAEAIAGELGIPFYRLSAPEIVSGTSGESELRLRELFSSAAAAAPALIFIDEIDAIAPKREGGSSSGGVKGMERRIVAQLLTCMDSLTATFRESHKHVMVLGATNRPDALDSALRRAGRFDREILVGVPDEEGREAILNVMTSQMRVSGDFDLREIAKKTPGYVGADLRSLTKESAVIAINRIFQEHMIVDNLSAPPISENLFPIVKDPGHASAANENENGKGFFSRPDAPIPLTAEQMEPLYITMNDFIEATKHVQPSSKREGFATVPDVTWDDIGALKGVREELALSVLEPINNPERFKELGLPLPAGVLLYGPPGCGKTLLAKAIAAESGTNFISVKGPELLDKYVGESERAVRRVFERARASAPCVVFFDELDSLCPKRGSDASGGGSGVSERVVNQLLTEMDGLDSRRSVFVIAATNRPELIDPAMMRP